jgi:hypothetical protein
MNRESQTDLRKPLLIHGLSLSFLRGIRLFLIAKNTDSRDFLRNLRLIASINRDGLVAYRAESDDGLGALQGVKRTAARQSGVSGVNEASIRGALSSLQRRLSCLCSAF